MTSAPKPWYKSIVIWVNIISAAALAFEQCGALLREHMEADTFAWVAFAVAIVNIYLRLYVHRPLEYHHHHHDKKHSSDTLDGGGGDSGV